MIKKIFVAVLLLPSFAFAEFDMSQYKFVKSLEGLENSPADAFFYIDNDIYREGNQFFSDLRVIDQEGKEVPYIIGREVDRVDRDFFQEDIEVVSSQENVFLLDMGNNPEYYESITIVSDSQDFSRVVDVYGSNLVDERFEHLSHNEENYIFSGPTGTGRKISFRYNNYRFIKIIFEGNEGDFEAQGFSMTKRATQLITGDKNIFTLPTVEVDARNESEQSFLLTMEEENIPVDFLKIKDRADFSTRKIEIFSSNSLEARFLESNKRYNKNETYWKKVSDGNVERENQLIAIDDNKKYYLIVVHKGDDKNVVVGDVEITSYKNAVYMKGLDFKNNSYSVLYGNKSDKKPKYDSGSIQKNKDGEVMLGQQRDNKQYVEVPKRWWEESRYISSVLVVLSVLILFWFVYRILKESSTKRMKAKDDFVNRL